MSRGPLMMVPGHEIGAAAWGSPAPHDADGSQLPGPRTAPGYARCTCGELSAESLPTGAARLRWLKRHREEIAGVPWSDRAQQEKTLRNWPETFAERGIGTVLRTAWEESAPGCWTGIEGIGGVVNLAVTDDASGLCVAARMPAGFEVTPHRWLAMAEALADMMRGRGYRVTCAVPDCEYGRWSCPKRIAWAITVNPALGAWNGTDDAARHRPVSDGRIETDRG